MRLKKMEIVGFKSFGEKSVISFPPGISAIVGPNGCGKSNIFDALRWAMGEMSVKQLRGKSMEDIIFAGAGGKSPLNLAEVSLTLSNENGTAPEELKEFAEISLTRRLYRSGESLYMINRQPCRLKDIHNIFLGSGMGAKSYSVIQQGNIGAITDAGPEERRFFIEEAAGISRYKQRKKETLKKLDATQQNLVRVRDIVAEVERQMKVLDRQAKKALHYRRCREQIRIFDLRIALGRWDAYAERIRKNDGLLKDFKDADIEYTTRLNRLDAAVEEIKLRRSRKNQDISKQKTDRFELQRRIDRSENDLKHQGKEIEELIRTSENLKKLYDELDGKNRRMIEERAAIDQQNHALAEEVSRLTGRLAGEKKDSEAVRTRLGELRQAEAHHKRHLLAVVAEEAKYQSIYQNVTFNRDHLKRRLRKVDEEEALAAARLAGLKVNAAEGREKADICRREIKDCEVRIQKIHHRIDQERGSLALEVKRVQTLEYDRNHVRSRYTALEKMARNFEWYRDGVKTILQNADPTKIHGLLADVLEPDPAVIPAVEAVLGEALQYVLVRDVETGQAAIDRLRAENGGRGGFVPISPVGRRVAEGAPEKSGDFLLQHMEIKPGFEDVVQSLLGAVVLADSMEAALESRRRNGEGITFVTREGNVVSHQGVMIGGSEDQSTGILTKKQELKALARRLAELDDAIETARTDQQALEVRVKNLDKELHGETEEKNRLHEQERGVERSLIQVTEELKHAARSLEILRMEQDQLLGDADRIDEEASRCNKTLIRITEDVKAAQATVAEIDRDTSAIAVEAHHFEAKITDLKLRLTERKAALENGVNTARRLKEFQADGVVRLDQVLKDIGTKEQQRRDTKAGRANLETALAGMYEEIKGLEKILKSSEEEYRQIENLLEQRGGSRTEIQGMREDLIKKIRMVEVEQSQLHIQRQTVESAVEERYQRPPAAFREELDALALGRAMPTEEMETVMADLKKKLERIGDVHLGAIDEYQTLHQRHGFLQTQQEDLVKAVDDLHKVIRKINRISQEKFLETFGMINERLAEVFPRLFSGGSARLILTEPNDPLETGVEFMVHPPGKKLTRLTLLSGGEKALSAIAFIFSIFLIKPASFCIMDEIDAPLDEANVYRFNELLKIIGEKSQIIMITHKKKSMEFADTLFGITMEQKGISKIVSVNFEGKTAEAFV